ncbi:MAG: hypothetical protein V1881_00315 [Candidatus Micrarchaeota archaeon]
MPKATARCIHAFLGEPYKLLVSHPEGKLRIFDGARYSATGSSQMLVYLANVGLAGKARKVRVPIKAIVDNRNRSVTLTAGSRKGKEFLGTLFKELKDIKGD